MENRITVSLDSHLISIKEKQEYFKLIVREYHKELNATEKYELACDLMDALDGLFLQLQVCETLLSYLKEGIDKPGILDSVKNFYQSYLDTFQDVKIEVISYEDVIKGIAN